MKLSAKKLSQNDIDKIVNKKLVWILANSEPLKVILFGSAARGEMSDSSDVDLILIYSDDKDLKSVQKNLFESRPTEDWPHDLLVLSEEGFEIQSKKGGGACWLAQTEGRVLYERKK